jgi:cytochrome c oxidase cbb3-type subunit 3
MGEVPNGPSHSLTLATSRQYCLGLMSLFLVAALAAAPVVAPADVPGRGAFLFTRHCAPCHGPQGEGGRGPRLAVPKLVRVTDLASLKKVIRSGIEGTEMPEFKLAAEDQDALADWVLHLGQLPPEIVPGDVERGRQLYTKKGACTVCHTIRGHGGALGPDLTEIGLLRGAAYLRRALVAPAAEVPKGFSSYRHDISISLNFLQVRVVTRDGQSLTGVRLNEDSFSIQMRDATNRIHSFQKSELRELHKDWGETPMPAYGDVFSSAEMDDMVAFLVSLRGER